MISHEGEGEHTRTRDGRGEGSGKEIDHKNRKGSKNQGNDAEIPFGFCKRVELVGEHKEEGRVKKSGILSVKSELGSKIIPGVVEGMDLIHP